MDLRTVVEVAGFLLTTGGMLVATVYKLTGIERALESKLTEVLIAVRGFTTWQADHTREDDEREQRTQAELIRLRDTVHSHGSDLQAVKTRLTMKESHA